MVILKKISLCVCIIFILVFLNGCNFDPYSDERPYDYGDAKWVCEELNAWFIVDSTQEDYYRPEGKIEINGTLFPCKLYFVHQTNSVFLVILESDYLDTKNTEIGEIYGDCTFSEEKLIIHVTPEEDTLFNGQYEKLTFVRNSIE